MRTIFPVIQLQQFIGWNLELQHQFLDGNYPMVILHLCI
jgi:hypothetical protein